METSIALSQRKQIELFKKASENTPRKQAVFARSARINSVLLGKQAFSNFTHNGHILVYLENMCNKSCKYDNTSFYTQETAKSKN